MAPIMSPEKYREIKCCFSVTIRRDAWGVPVAIMGQWIVSLPLRGKSLSDDGSPCEDLSVLELD